MIEDAMTDAAANFAFGLIILALFGAVILVLLFTSLAIRYTIRRIRRWFVENVMLPKAETERHFFRRTHG